MFESIIIAGLFKNALALGLFVFSDSPSRTQHGSSKSEFQISESLARMAPQVLASALVLFMLLTRYVGSRPLSIPQVRPPPSQKTFHRSTLLDCDL